MNINTSATYTGGLPERADKEASPPPEAVKASSGEPRILPERKILPEQKIIPTDTRITSAVSAETIFAALVADETENAGQAEESGAESATDTTGEAEDTVARAPAEAA